MIDTNPIAKELFFEGRFNDPRMGKFVSHKTLRELKENLPEKKQKKEYIAIIGCPDDLGVRLNYGRPGCKLGPNNIRKHFYKMAPPVDFFDFSNLEIWDLGNIFVSTDILQTHENARQVLEELHQLEMTTIILGGGHDFAAPCFSGFSLGRGVKKNKIGLINIDPHLDVRPFENGLPHSGSAFRELIEKEWMIGSNLIQFGTQIHRNAKAHYEFCKEKKIPVLFFHELMKKKQRQSMFLNQIFEREFKKLCLRCKEVGMTVDLDSCSDGEGSSAAPVLGFSAEELWGFCFYAGQNHKVRYFELAEVSPDLDVSERTSRIAAELLFSFLLGRSKALPRAKIKK